VTTGSAGFGSGCGVSGSVEVLFASSGRGTDLAAGVLWDSEPGSRTEAGGSEGTDAVSGVARSSGGVRKLSFKGSTSSGDETRRLQSVGDPAGFSVAGSS